jgi:hypothetical protein
MMPSLFRSRRGKKQLTTDRSGSSPTSPSVPNPESTVADSGVKVMSLPISLPTSGTLPTNLAVVPPPEGLPATSSVSDMFAEAWNVVKDEAKVANSSRGLGVVGGTSVPRILFYGS